MASKAPCTLSLSRRVLFRSKQPGRGRQGDAAGCAAPLDKVVPVDAIGPQCGWGEGEAAPASAARLVRMVAVREAAAGSMTAVLPGSSREVAGACKDGLSRRLQLCLICRVHGPTNQLLKPPSLFVVQQGRPPGDLTS